MMMHRPAGLARPQHMPRARSAFAFGVALVALSMTQALAQTGAPSPAGDAQAGKARAAVCAGCHGPDGNSAAPMFPKLASQDPAYIRKQLQDFKSGARQSAQMQPFAAQLNPQDIANVAAYYASQKIQPGAAQGDKAVIDLGKKIYRGGNAKTGVSACMSCHGPSGHGIPPRFPKVSGQHAAYTEQQLVAFKNSTRTNDDTVMQRIAFRMSEAEIRAVAQYMAGLH